MQLYRLEANGTLQKNKTKTNQPNKKPQWVLVDNKLDRNQQYNLAKKVEHIVFGLYW